MRAPQVTCAILLLGAAASANGAGRVESSAPPGLRERIELKLANDPALAATLGKPAPEMESAAWLIGTWQVEATTAGQPKELGTSVVKRLFDGSWLEIRDSYPEGTQDVGYLGYNSALRKWQSVSIDSLGNANISLAPGWDGDRLIFEADAIVVGVSTHLRQIFSRVSAREYRISNEELVDGRWRQVDEYRYLKQGPTNEPGG